MQANLANLTVTLALSRRDSICFRGMEGRYETAIVGGGPAGLTAAIHLAWHQRKVVVMDRRSGPLFFTLEGLHNVPGVPVVRGLDLQKKLMAQA